MRILVPTTALLVLAAALLPLAAAHRTHGECESTEGPIHGTPHVDFYNDLAHNCLGITVAGGGQCSLENDFETKYTHLLVSYGQACQTGLIVDLP